MQGKHPSSGEGQKADKPKLKAYRSGSSASHKSMSSVSRSSSSKRGPADDNSEELQFEHDDDEENSNKRSDEGFVDTDGGPEFKRPMHAPLLFKTERAAPDSGSTAVC
jgi:hypothetical protein